MVFLFDSKRGSSSSTNDHKYDVFLSFRGVDTRLGFTDHLYKALMGANIVTFLDDEEIETGGFLKPELESAIKESKVSIIVLSKNYANSSWCLDELVLILGERKASNQIVVPIFYHVEPTDVRKQQSSFGDAMANHIQVMKAEKYESKRSQMAQKIARWIQALTEVADLKGMNVDGRRETEFIEEIVKDMYRILHISSRIPLPQLIGMYDSKEFAISWLKDTSSHTTSILTILGMGGIGKTSLAKYIYALHADKYDISSLIEDISSRCEQNFNGLLDLQKQLYNDISRTSSIHVHDVSIYTSKIENAIAHKKVLLVLDDIDSLKQLDALLGSKGFHPGSKIIITTRDAWLTESCALFKTNLKLTHAKHLLKGLYNDDAKELLCFHAFMSNGPKAGYEEVVNKLVMHCQGNPLALQILGKSLSNRDVVYWEERMEELKKENSSSISNVLRTSFDSLPSKNDKDLFKHIACFFVGMDRDFTETILKECYIKTRSGIMNLIDRCLLGIGRNNELIMHNLIQDLGRFLVRQESPDKPWKQSRLWCHEESYEVLKQKKGKGNLVGLTLDMRMLEKEKIHRSLEFQTDSLSKMDNLILLKLNYVQMNGSYKNFSEKLRWLCMHGFPLKCIPPDLPMDNLVALDMSYSNIESFVACSSNLQIKSSEQLTTSCEKDKRLLGSLKILNLSFCERLRSLFGFVELPMLEKLIATNCNELLEVCESVDHCVSLAYIDLRYCNKLEKLTMGKLKKVDTLLLDGCNLGGSQIKISDMDLSESVNANNISITKKISSSDVLEPISSDSKFFKISLPSSLVKLSLEKNNLFTESFPIDFSCLSMLKELYLDENPLTSMPNSVRTLPRLQILSMSYCKGLTSVEHPPKTLTFLNLRSYERHLLQKIVFDPQMCPLDLSMSWTPFTPFSCEYEGMVKIQPIAGVEEKVLNSLCWTKLDFLNKLGVQLYSCDRRSEDLRIQMYYEFGIFSTIYGGKDMPKWITCRSKLPSISFTIPSSPDKLVGMNFCYVYRNALPIIIVHNITKNRTWMYDHCIRFVNVGEECYTMLSHWMFGTNEMESGDVVSITIKPWKPLPAQFIGECGVSLVYDDGKMAEEEDALGYYKSWNHIIGGDLTPYQLTSGLYILCIRRITIYNVPVYTRYRGIISGRARYKEKYVRFRALTQRKPDILGRVPKDIGTSTCETLILNDEDEVDQHPKGPYVVIKFRDGEGSHRKASGLLGIPVEKEYTLYFDYEVFDYRKKKIIY